MKVVVTGANGMLGHKIVQVLGRSHSVLASTRSDRELLAATGIVGSDFLVPAPDIDDPEVFRSLLDTHRPDVVINCIGLIKHREIGKDAISNIRVNSLLPHLLAKACDDAGARFITFSTDCVFSGDSGGYIETDCSDARDIYGKSKHLGEVTDSNCLTLRTSIIGRELSQDRSLVEWLISNRGGAIKGFRNAIYSGLTTVAIAEIVRKIVSEHADLTGLYHLSSRPIDKYTLLSLINDIAKLGISIAPDADFSIDRSLNSDKLSGETGISAPDWLSMVEAMVAEFEVYERWRTMSF